MISQSLVAVAEGGGRRRPDLEDEGEGVLLVAEDLEEGPQGQHRPGGALRGGDGVRVAPPTGEDSRYWVRSLDPPGWGQGCEGGFWRRTTQKQTFEVM